MNDFDWTRLPKDHSFYEYLFRICVTSETKVIEDQKQQPKQSENLHLSS